MRVQRSSEAVPERIRVCVCACVRVCVCVRACVCGGSTDYVCLCLHVNVHACGCMAGYARPPTANADTPPTEWPTSRPTEAGSTRPRRRRRTEAAAVSQNGKTFSSGSHNVSRSSGKQANWHRFLSRKTLDGGGRASNDKQTNTLNI